MNNKMKTFLLLVVLGVLFVPTAFAQEVSFQLDKTEGCSPLVVVVQNTSTITDPNAIYKWQIDNQEIQEKTIATQVFKREGNHNISLSVYDQNFNLLGEKSAIVNVTSGIPSIKTGTGLEACMNEPVHFQLENSFKEINWDFGNGLVSDHYGEEIAFKEEGTYHIKAEYTTLHCGDKVAEIDFIVRNNATPVARAFTLGGPEACPNDEVVFKGYNDALEYTWLLPDGITLKGNTAKFAFKAPGEYTVNYTVTNKCGNSAGSANPIIVYIRDDIEPEASFFTYPENPCPNTPVTLEAHGNGHLNWSFDNGFTSNDRKVEHFFPEEGNHLVQLTLVNGCGRKSTTEVIIPVKKQIDAIIDLWAEVFIGDEWVDLDVPLCPNTKLRFEAHGDYTDGIQYNWFIAPSHTPTNKQAISNQRELEYTFINSGSFIISVNAESPCGTNANYEFEVSIDQKAPPISEPQAAPMQVCPGDKVLFFDEVDADKQLVETTYSIEYGDGQTTGSLTEPIPGDLDILAEHSYAAVGNYVVKFKAISGCGGEIVREFSIQVNEDNTFRPDYYVGNSSDKTEYEPKSNVQLPVWDKVGTPEAHTFDISVSLEQPIKVPTTVYAIFWYGENDVYGDLPDPSGMLPIVIQPGVAGEPSEGTAKAYVPKGLHDKITIAIANYCGGTPDFSSEPASLSGYNNPVNQMSVYAITVNGTTTLPMNILSDAYPACQTRNLFGIWESESNGVKTQLEFTYNGALTQYKLLLDYGDGEGYLLYDFGSFSTTGDMNLELSPSGDINNSACLEVFETQYTFTSKTQSEFTLSTTAIDGCDERKSFLANKTFKRSTKPTPAPLEDRVLGEWFTQNEFGVRFEFSIWESGWKDVVSYRLSIKDGDAESEVAYGNATIESATSKGDGMISFGTGELLEGENYVEDYRCVDNPATYSIYFIDNRLVLVDTGEDLCTKRSKALSGNEFSRSDLSRDVCVGQKVKFEAVGGSSYEWHFGDEANTTSTQQFPQFSFNTPGYYNAYVRITNGCGGVHEVQTPVTIKSESRVEATFELKANSFPVGGLVKPHYHNFNDDLDENIYSWDFGDGTTEVTREVEHQYKNPGEYTITLTVLTACGSASHSKKVVIKSTEEESCKASFKVVDVNHDTRTLTVENTSFNIQQGEWHFERGTPAVLANSATNQVKYTFAKDGDYMVTLLGFNEASGCADRITMPLQIGHTDPNCDVKITPIINNTTLEATLKVEASSNITEWYWVYSDFDAHENAPVNGEIKKKFARPGIYEVFVAAWDDQDCYIEEEFEIKVGNRACEVEADFSYFPDHETKTVVFVNESSETADRFIWKFGDGNQAHGRTAKHTFTEDKTYFVSLQAWDTQNKCADHIGFEIQVGDGACKADFKVKVDPATKAVTFDNISTGADEYFWIFDDEDYSEEKSPIHTYKETGLYFSELVIYNDETGCEHNIIVPVQVGAPACKAYFDTNIDGKEVSFEDLSQGVTENTRYLWLFDDASELFGESNPTHTYPRGGKYHVTLLIGDPDKFCFDEYTAPIELEVQEFFAQPDFAFRTNFETREVKFINKTTPVGKYNYTWDFNDGSAIDHSENPIHSFPNRKNIFDVTLTVGVDKDGDNVDDYKFSTHQRVTVGKSCVADFSYTKKDANKNWAQCINSSTITESSVSYTWKFGDEGISTEKNPEWVFKEDKTYWVFLGVKSGSCEDHIIKMINVSGENKMACGFNVEQNTDVAKKPAGHPTDFYGTSYGGDNVKWEFGDDSDPVDNTLSPTHTYEEPGVYLVTMTVTDPITGEIATYTKEVIINGKPIANAGIDSKVTEGQWVTLDASASKDETSVGSITYSWTSPANITLDDNTSAAPNFQAPDVAIATPYTFILHTNDGEFTSDPDEVVITVEPLNDQPVANAGTDKTVGEGSVVVLAGVGTDPNNDELTYKWTTPSGITLSDYANATPNFIAPTVTEATTYTLTLTVNDGTIDSEMDEVTITVNNVITGIEDVLEVESFKVHPNPAQSNCRISFRLHKASNIELALFDIAGKRIKTFVNTRQNTIPQTIDWDVTQVKHGTYMIRLITESGSTSKKIIVD